MKLFSSIFEATKRFYEGGTPFSNGHRTKSVGGFLENRHYLIDIDMIIYDNDSIKAIVEKKFKADSKMGNILKDREHFQRKMLLNFSEKIKAKLLVNITSENKYYQISDGELREYTPEKFLEAQSKYLTYNSDDSIFIEFRSGQPAAIIKRLEDGINVDGLLDKISKLLKVDVFKVDDVNTAGKIIFYTFDKKFIGSVDILKTESERTLIENQWKEVYQKINLW